MVIVWLWLNHYKIEDDYCQGAMFWQFFTLKYVQMMKIRNSSALLNCLELIQQAFIIFYENYSFG